MCVPYIFFFEAMIDYYHDLWNPTEHSTKHFDLRRYPLKQADSIAFSAFDQTPDGAGHYNKSMSVQSIISGQEIRKSAVWKFLSEDFVVIQNLQYLTGLNFTERRNEHVQDVFVSN